MRKKDFTLDDLIWDKFDLPLYEDSTDDFYTLDEIKQEVEERISRLASLGKGYVLLPEQVVKYVITERTDITAGTKPVDDWEYMFVISKQVARKRNERFLDNIIYHELCHMLQLEFLFNSDIIYFRNGKRVDNPEHKERVQNWLHTDGGHTDLWYTFVHKVNSAFAINPPVDKALSDKDVSDIFLESTFHQESFNNIPYFDGFYEYIDWSRINAYRTKAKEQEDNKK